MNGRDRDPLHLHPVVRALWAKHVEMGAGPCTARGWRLTTIETWRSDAQQALDYGRGRNVAGEVIFPKEVVTYNPPGGDWHGITLPDGTPASFAYHLVPENDMGISGYGDVPTDETAYGILIGIGRTLGITCGADWKSLKDLSHYELHPNGATLSQVKAAILAGRDLGATLREA